MRNITGDVSQALHQLLDSREHPIEAFRQSSELVVRADNGNAARQIAVHDGPRRTIHCIDPAQKQSPDNESPTECQHDRRPQGDTEGTSNQRPRLGEVRHVIGHQHERVVVEPLTVSTEHTMGIVRSIGAGRHGNVLPAHLWWNERKIAGDLVLRTIRYEKMNATVRLLINVLLHETDHGVSAILLQVVTQDLELLIDAFGKVALEEGDHRPVDHPEQDPHYDRREGREDKRVPHGGSSRQFEKFHESSGPRLQTVPRTPHGLNQG